MNIRILIVLLGFVFIAQTISCNKDSSNSSFYDCAETSTLIDVGGKKLIIPNIITPNYDGFNDYWIIKTYPVDSTSPEITIGVKVQKQGNNNVTVFESSNYHGEWSGRFNNELLENGQYLYEITTIDTLIVGYVCIYTSTSHEQDHVDCIEQCSPLQPDDPILNINP